MFSFSSSIIALLLLVLAAPVLAGEYTVLTNELPPIKFTKDGLPCGIAGDVLTRIMKENGMVLEPGDVRSAHITECLSAIHDNPKTIIMAIAKNILPQSDCKWVGTVGNTTFGFLARKDRHILMDSVEDAMGYKVATMVNCGGEKLAFKQGLPKDTTIRAKTPAQAIGMLVNDEVDLLVYPKSPAFYAILRMNGAPEQFEMVYELKTVDFHIAFSPETDDAIISRLQRSLDRLKQPGEDGMSEFDKIALHYFIPAI